jgi:hypothetical protein
MLCGAMLTVGPDVEWPAVHTAGDSFTDDAPCGRCVRVLGDQQWRAFHAGNRSGRQPPSPQGESHELPVVP